MASAVVGIDAGATKTYGLLLAGEEIVDTFLADTCDSCEEDVIDSIAGCFEELRSRAAGRGLGVKALGLGMAGYIDYPRGVVTESPNLPLRDLPLRDLLTGRLGVPVALDNDANAAALAENRLGAGRGCLQQVHLTLGTGIGGGLIIDGKVYHGARGTAAELGHVIIQEGGPVTNCGHRGCLEALASGTAVEREAHERFAAGWHPEGFSGAGPEELTARDVAEAAGRGDPVALAIWEEMGRHLGTGIAGYINIFNPEMVTLSGGLLSAWDFFQPSMFRAVEENSIPLSYSTVRIARTSLGGEAGALGAALLAHQD